MLRGSLTALVTPLKRAARSTRKPFAFVDWQIQEGTTVWCPSARRGIADLVA
jgi:hypothetical protein